MCFVHSESGLRRFRQKNRNRKWVTVYKVVLNDYGSVYPRGGADARAYEPHATMETEVVPVHDYREIIRGENGLSRAYHGIYVHTSLQSAKAGITICGTRILKAKARRDEVRCVNLSGNLATFDRIVIPARSDPKFREYRHGLRGWKPA